MQWRHVRYVLLLIALCSMATCPAAKRGCTAKARAREADGLLDYLADRVARELATTGRLPATPAGPTPDPGCCAQGGTCSPDPELWATPGWRTLRFRIDDDHRYSYTYAPDPRDPSGRTAVVRAIGDLDCNGTPSVYEIQLRATPGGLTRTRSRERPYE